MLPIELVQQMEKTMSIGETVRILHEECSRGKSPALSIRRTATGWLWNCFRCGFQGYKTASNLSPAELLKQLEHLQNTNPSRIMSNVALPVDYFPISEVTRGMVPVDALGWLWRYHLDFPMLKLHNVGWSPYYKRIIFPVYNTELLDNEDKATQVIGWFGRDIVSMSKTEREKNNCPKWLIQKSKGLSSFFYHIPSSSKTIILVEDVVSAIRVSNASGHQTLALGTTFIPLELVIRLKDFEVVLWLDGDMRGKMLNYLAKFKTMGINVSFRHTPWDPKEYSSCKILAILRGESP